MRNPLLLALVAIAMLAVLPFFFAQLIVGGLAKLHLSPEAALRIALAILLGGLVNIPVARIPRAGDMPPHRAGVFGLPERSPWLRQRPRETVVAVNLGGCLVPLGVAAYVLAHLAAGSPQALLAAAAATGVVAFVCFRLAQPVAGVGIVLPAFVPPLAAAAAALLLAPDGAAPPVAFVAGVVGTLVGADLLHLRDIGKISSGIASIGGAGTFDGIVLSGILAAYLA